MSNGLEVVQATYGAGTTFTDVTTEVQAMVKDGDLNFTVSPQSLGIIDPAPGVIKTFQAKVILNGGQPTILSKNDSEQFAISAPAVPDKAKPTNHASKLGIAIWYFIVGICATYFGYSSYLLGLMGFESKILGYILGAVVGGAFLLIGSAEVGLGIFAFILTLPNFMLLIALFVFLYSLYNPVGINFNYPIKKITQEVLSNPKAVL